MASGRFIVECGERSRTVEVSAGGEVSVEGAAGPLRVTAVGTNEYQVANGTRRSRVFVAGCGESREVFLDGQVFRFEVANTNDRPRTGSVGHADQPTAPMPGTVVKLLVTVGDRVDRNQVLLKLEAMKMELPIRAAHTGKIAAVHCREGELVQAGARLLDVEWGQI